MLGGPGHTTHQLASRSFLRHRRVLFLKARAASAAIVVASVDPDAVAVGANLTLAALSASGFKYRYGRRITLTLNDDDAGGGLTCTVLIKGFRWGRKIQESLTVLCTDTNDTVATTTKVFDGVTSITLTAKTADAGDALTMGWDAGALGLPFPVDQLTDVFSITKITSGTEQTPIAVSSTSFSVAESALIGLTLAAADDYEVECLIGRKKADGIDGAGSF